MKPWLSAGVAILVLIAGFSGLWIGTNGGAAWTAESARRLAVLSSPQPLPSVQLQDAREQSFSLASFDRPFVVIDFIYTRCPTVCIEMGSAFSQLQNKLVNLGIDDKVYLLSLTIDPLNDDAKALGQYLERFGAISGQWLAARFQSDEALKRVLAQLGVIVIPEPKVGFVHNAAVYLSYKGKVVGIFDIEDQKGLLEAISWRLTKH